MAHADDQGAVPSEFMRALNSEVHHLRDRIVEDRTDRTALDTRLRAVEIEVGHLSRITKWGLAILGALIVSGFGGMLLHGGVTR